MRGIDRNRKAASKQGVRAIERSGVLPWETGMTGILYLAVDGGGTNTRARLYDEDDKLIGEGLSGSSNLTLGTEIAGPAIAAAGDAALAAAGLAPDAKRLVRAGLGLSGGNIPALADSIAAFPFGYGALTVTSDAVTACLGAHAGEDGHPVRRRR